MPTNLDEGSTDILDRMIAGRTVRESMAAATAAGAIVPVESIGWTLPAPSGLSRSVGESKDAQRDCRFYLGVLFPHVYRKKQVPAGCASCYKVKVVPKTLRQLHAVLAIARALPYTFKVQVEAATPTVSGIYGAYFYRNSLDDAREAAGNIRAAVDGHPQLGPDVTVFIKRGCTEYELAVGPSDGYTFSPEVKEFEAELRSRVKTEGRVKDPRGTAVTYMAWITTAYSLGDETYLDFTGGRRLYRAVVRYPFHSEAQRANDSVAST